jgi:addiction module RelE/StbE family toxin
MSYTLIFTGSYKKRAKRFAQKHPDLKEPYRKTLQLLAFNPYHPSLRIHPLKGKLSALHSVSINLSYRITLEILITEKEIILVNVGSHEDVYQAG